MAGNDSRKSESPSTARLGDATCYVCCLQTCHAKQPITSIHICAEGVCAAIAGRRPSLGSYFQEEKQWLAWMGIQKLPLVPMSSRELIGLQGTRKCSVSRLV